MRAAEKNTSQWERDPYPNYTRDKTSGMRISVLKTYKQLFLTDSRFQGFGTLKDLCFVKPLSIDQVLAM